MISKDGRPISMSLIAALILTSCTENRFRCKADEFSIFEPPSVAVTHFGWSLDIHGSKALVGSFADNHHYIYDLNTGQEVLRLDPNEGSAGESVQLSDQYALISEFLFDAHSGQLLRKFSGLSVSNGFGWAAAMNDDLVVIGDFADDTRGTQAGAVYLFDLHTGQRVDKLLPDNFFSTGNDFGRSVEIAGNSLLIGASGAPGRFSSDGAVYVYDLATRIKLRTLAANDTTGGAEFGRAISIDGNLALIGAPRDANRGAAYLFDFETGTQIRKFTPLPSANTLESFGSQVALMGNYALIGSPFRSVEGRGSAVGSAFLYDIESGQLLRTFLPDDVQSQNNFGWGLDFNQFFLAFSAPDGLEKVYYVTVPEPASYLLAIAYLASIPMARRGDRSSGRRARAKSSVHDAHSE